MIIIPPAGRPLDARAFVLDLTAAFNDHDPDAVAAFYAEDAVFDDWGAGLHVVGRAAIRELVAGMFAASPDACIQKTGFVVQSGRFADEFVFSGTHSGDSPGLPATNRPYRISVAGIGEIVHRRIVRHSMYWNAAEYLAQLGVLPGPGATVPAPDSEDRSARVPVPR